MADSPLNNNGLAIACAHRQLCGHRPAHTVMVWKTSAALLACLLLLEHLVVAATNSSNDPDGNSTFATQVRSFAT